MLNIFKLWMHLNEKNYVNNGGISMTPVFNGPFFVMLETTFFS